ncbi:putative nitroreductase [Syntrophobacter sp. SbD1]|nr:putative nitroreductase [Syntrophobacter sp. SbD1]
MELRQAIRTRRSIRCFLPRPVSTEIIQELISESLWAPSWTNTQPWEIVAVTGEPLEQFKRENKAALLAGRTSAPDISMPCEWPAALKKRSMELSKNIFESLGIGQDDADGRVEYYARLYHLFDAPALILVLIDKELSLEYAMLNAGIFLQTFLLLAHDAGLGACIFAGTVHCPEIVHRNFAIPNTKLLAIGIALGWPDIDAPINNFERKRGKVEEFVRWIS